MNFDPAIDPTSELLDVWKRWVRYTHVDGIAGARLWGDRDTPQRNAVADGEMLECLLLPGMVLKNFDLRRVFVTGEADSAVADARATLTPAAAHSALLTFRELLLRCTDYMEFHRDADDRPTFRADGYVSAVQEPLPEGEFPCDFVDAYSFAVSITVQLLRLLRALEDHGELPELTSFYRSAGVEPPDFTRVEALASERLTAAMEGLRDSFVVASANSQSWGYALRLPKTDFGERLFPPELAPLRAQVERYSQTPLSEGKPWECGFTWGRARNVLDGHGWLAEPAPYLYSTVVALDGIRDVTSADLLSLNILTPHQAALATELAFCASVTAQYWSAIAFAAQPATGLWRVEDIPWRTPDFDEDEYYTLLVLRLLVAERAETEERTGRLVRVVEELAQRARITRHPVVDRDPHRLGASPNAARATANGTDSALRLHHPGKLLRLDPAPGVEGVPVMLRIYDFAPQLLKLAAQLGRSVEGGVEQERMRLVIEATWRHLHARRSPSPRRDPMPQPGTAWASWPPHELWDTRGLTLDVEPEDDPRFRGVNSWYMTERVIEALVALVELRQTRPPVRPSTVALLDDLVSEIEWRVSLMRSGGRSDYLGRLRHINETIAEGETAAATYNALQLLTVIREQKGAD